MAVPQNRSQYRHQDNIPPLAYARTHPGVIVNILLPLALVAPQQVLHEVKAPPARPAHTVLVKFPPLQPGDLQPHPPSADLIDGGV
ncbi:hypothetical protein BDZ97DRAFT_1860063, partial [Flammula alnicola]